MLLCVILVTVDVETSHRRLNSHRNVRINQLAVTDCHFVALCLMLSSLTANGIIRLSD